MWWVLAFISAALLGGYDASKKVSLTGNAVIPVLFLNTVFCAIIFSPLLISSGWGSWDLQKYILIKSALVLSSWMAGYYAMKNLPLTIVGPLNATRPVLVLIGAVLLFGEQLNLLQWAGVALAILAYFLLRISGKSEGIDFGHNKWIFLLILAVLLGAASGLYDKYLMSPKFLGMNRDQVLGWYSLYQAIMMLAVFLLGWLPLQHSGIGYDRTPFKWRWSIPLISIFLCGADYAYMQSLAQPGALIAVVSMIRRGSMLVSFVIGAFLLKENNIKAKAFDMALLLASMVFLYLGSK